MGKQICIGRGIMMGENIHKFQKLTPVDDVDLALYEDTLDFVFDP